MRLLVVLGLICAAAWWWWWEPDRDRAARARTSQQGDVSKVEPGAVSQVDPGAEDVGLEGDLSGFIDGDLWAPRRLSVVEVIDPDGRPVEAALVVVIDFDLETLADRRIAASSTDAEGVAHFDDLEASRVKARKAGYTIGSASVDEQKVRVTLKPALALRGRAVVLGGGPAAGATIRVWDKDEDDEIDLVQTADQDGGFSLTGIREHHPFILVATYPDHAPVVMELPEPGEVLVTFGGGLTLTGDVADESGNPMTSAVVVAPEGAESPFERGSVRLGYEQRELMAMARPNCEQGHFSVRGMKPGAYEVYARGEGGIGKTRITLDGDRHVEVRVVRLATLVVNVVGPSGEQVERDYVAAHRDDDWEHDRGGEKMVLEPGRYVVIANGESYLGVRKAIELRPGEERAIEMRLLEGLAVTGRVVDEQGKPVLEAQAGINQKILDWYGWEQHTKTSTGGAWGVRGLAPGKGTLHVSAKDYYEYRQEVEVADGAHYDVRLERRGKVVGRFVPPPEDKHLAVSFDHANGLSGTSAEMKDDGSFEFEDPAIAGPVTVTLTPKGKTPVVLRDFVFRRGQTHDLGDLALLKAVTLRLTILDGAGTPVEGALVEIRDPGYVPGLRTGANGYLEVEDQPQKLVLRIIADGHAATYRRVNATRPVTIRLTRGVAVNGRVFGPNGEPAPHTYVVFWTLRADGSIDDAESWKPEVDGFGKFAFLLPPGKFRVRVYGKYRQLLPETFEAKEGASFKLKMR